MAKQIVIRNESHLTRLVNQSWEAMIRASIDVDDENIVQGLRDMYEETMSTYRDEMEHSKEELDKLYRIEGLIINQQYEQALEELDGQDLRYSKQLTTRTAREYLEYRAQVGMALNMFDIFSTRRNEKYRDIESVHNILRRFEYALAAGRYVPIRYEEMQDEIRSIRDIVKDYEDHLVLLSHINHPRKLRQKAEKMGYKIAEGFNEMRR